jgi:tetratricopeptide (TPR) repeat protein
MITIEVYNYWIQLSGIHEHIEVLGNEDIAFIENRFRDLLSLQSADEVRSELANADRRDNSWCGWYILSSVLQMDFNNPVAEDLLALIEWGLLVARYSDDTSSLEAHGTLLKGMLLHNMGKLADAQDSYRASIEAHQALSTRPDLLSVCLFCVAKLNADLDNIDEATHYYEQALRLVPGDTPDGANWLHLLTVQQERSVKQSNFINQLLKYQSPAQWTLLLKQNKSLIDNNDFVEMAKSRSRGLAVQEEYEQANIAATLVDVVLAFQGDDPEFRRELVRYYLHKNSFQQAEIFLKAMLQDVASDEELEYMLAHSLLQQSKSDEGTQVLKMIIESNPNHAGAHSYLGRVYVAERQWHLAQKHLETALRIEPDDAMARQFLGYIPKASVSYDPQSKAITIGGDISSTSPEDMAEALMVAIIAGNPDRADELLTAIADEKGEDVAQRVAAKVFAGATDKQTTHFDKAEQLFTAKRFSEAIEEYKLAIAENPEHWQAYMGLGDTHYMMGKYHLAATYFEESVAIQPYAPTYRYLGDAYMRIGQIDKAIKAYQSSVDTDPNYAPAKVALRMAVEYKGGN